MSEPRKTKIEVDEVVKGKKEAKKDESSWEYVTARTEAEKARAELAARSLSPVRQLPKRPSTRPQKPDEPAESPKPKSYYQKPRSRRGSRAAPNTSSTTSTSTVSTTTSST
eukprot:TRINITY_DN1346_c0_g1_i11.p1 TRINITY_DN1346_c0_g1~~TRINITY_DN1346_c0_g1_i11.p1  ORF type:complete len:111 (-),score=4.96 TRINITY_DN1346_c0_g1_i11:91-423(-)